MFQLRHTRISFSHRSPARNHSEKINARILTRLWLEHQNTGTDNGTLNVLTTRCDASGYRIPEIEHTKVVLNGTLLNEVCCPDAVARVLEAGTSSCESIHSFTPISLSLYINITHSSYHKKLHFQTNSNTKTQLRATMVVSVTHRLDSSTIRTAMSPSIQAVTWRFGSEQNVLLMMMIRI